MSQTLPAVSLASVALGQTGTVNLANVGPDANPSYTQKPPHLAVLNESGVGLLISFQQGGDSFYLPAGGWHTCAIVPGEIALNWQVQYILNVVGGAPVSQLLVTYYAPNEQVPSVPILGNSPIGGSVATTAIQTLSQEGRAKVLLTIDIGDSVLANLININNDGTTTWKVDVAGVAHAVLAIASSANFLQIGQAGDTSEVLGQLLVDQELSVNSGFDVKAVLKSIGGGHTLQDWNFGIATGSAAGISHAHGIKNTAGIATTPTVMFCTVDNTSGFTYGIANVDANNFTLYSNVNLNLWWVALLA